MQRYLASATKNENTEAEDEESAASQAIGASLAGEPIAMRSRLGKDGEIILAAHPIISAESVIGTVIVEQKYQRYFSLSANRI